MKIVPPVHLMCKYMLSSGPDDEGDRAPRIYRVQIHAFLRAERCQGNPAAEHAQQCGGQGGGVLPAQQDGANEKNPSGMHLCTYVCIYTQVGSHGGRGCIVEIGLGSNLDFPCQTINDCADNIMSRVILRSTD